ncbi:MULTISPECIES: hypothetical protein, partial [unclassified Bacillus (in: firmicutes)]|uniref:hypothetical protein n=1 Tax=unclassified Bacillus (in: firmicutes) TaxID=185979 RepID=UPI000660FF88
WQTVGGKGADFWNQQKYFFKKKNYMKTGFCSNFVYSLNPPNRRFFLFMKLHKSRTFGKEDRYGSGYITFGEKARSPDV